MRSLRTFGFPICGSLALLTLGCGEASGPEDTTPSGVDAVTASTEIPWRRGASADGNWEISWRPRAEPIPALDPFAVEVRVADGDGGDVESDVSVLVDASMPHHGHGMNVTPRITRTEDGWLAEGMLFHMPGRWEFVIDVLRDGEVERAQWTVELEP